MNDDPIAGELWFHTGARHYYFIEKIKVKKIDFIDENFRIFLDIYVYEDLYYGLSDILSEIKYKLKKMLPYTILIDYNTMSAI